MLANEDSLDVFEFEVGMLAYFVPDSCTAATPKRHYSNPHAPDTGPSAAVLSVGQDSFKDLHHKLPLDLATIQWRR